MQTTPINWTQKTWNPVRGCSKVSPGCVHCYGLSMARRFCNTVNGKPGPYRGLVTREGEWAGKAVLVPEHLGDPVRLRKPSTIFVNSMSDLFHETLTNEEIAAVFGVTARCSQHFFQVLTKRPERAREWFEWVSGMRIRADRFCICMAEERLGPMFDGLPEWPLPNVAIGVSVEDSPCVKRIDILKQIPAAIRFVSFEPLLELVLVLSRLGGIDQAIMGCESGSKRRHTETDVFVDLVQQCDDTGCLPFVKQIEIDGVVETDVRKFPRQLRRREVPEAISRILKARA